MLRISQLSDVTRTAYSQTSRPASISAKPSASWPLASRSTSASERLGPPPQDHDATLPAPALQAQLALLALPTGAGIMPILRVHRSLDRTLHPIRQAQLEQIRLATLLRLPHDRFVAPTG